MINGASSAAQFIEEKHYVLKNSLTWVHLFTLARSLESKDQTLLVLIVVVRCVIKL